MTNIYSVLPIELRSLIPRELGLAPVFCDLLDKERLLYNFGRILTMGEEESPCVGVGTVTHHELEKLNKSLSVAMEKLSKDDFEKWIKKINDPLKHEDYLFEVRPLLGMKNGVVIEHEVKVNHENDTNVDWKFDFGDYGYLVEVKNRVFPLRDYLSNVMGLVRLLNMGERPDNIKKITAKTDPEKLFKSVCNKFEETGESKFLQGVWISTGMKNDKDKLRKYFDSLDEKKIQFAIFSEWTSDVFLMVKNEDDRMRILEDFSLVQEED